MSSPTVTIVIHGTFASEATWWRLGKGGDAEFADNLEARLAKRGTEGSVWKPVIDAGMAYEDFAWSGLNKHKDRVAGARKIAESLGKLASRLGATKDDKLQVNLVAHSHGGNVALEILKVLPETVRARRVVMLGTPMVWRHASARMYAIAAAAALFIGIFAGIISELVASQQEDPLEGFGLWAFNIVMIVILLALIGPYLLIIEKPFIWGERILASIVSVARRGGPKGIPAYGPRVKELAGVVDEPPTLFTSRVDEADLALHIGASPRETYSALVRGHLGGAMRFIEPMYLRGMFSILVAPLAEAVTEHFVLGFGWVRVGFNNYEMVNFDGEEGTYGDTIRRIDVSRELVPALVEKLSQWRPQSTSIVFDRDEAEDLPREQRDIETLRSTIKAVAADIGTQMQLRHTVYYETDSVIEGVAEAIAG